MFSSASVLKTNCCISKTDKPSFQRTSIWVWSTPRKSTEINQICFPWQQIHPWDFVNNYRIFNKQTGNYFTVWGREDHRYYYSNLSINSCITSFDYRVVPDCGNKRRCLFSGWVLGSSLPTAKGLLLQTCTECIKHTVVIWWLLHRS